MSDRLNTIFGWLLFAGVVALLLRFVTGFVMPDEHRPEQLGYVIEGVATDVEVAEVPFAFYLANGSAANGEAAFARCIACHTIDNGGADGLGPNIHGVLGQPVGAASSAFAYSSAVADLGGEWTYDNMSDWLERPARFAPGTKMAFAGISDDQERADVILYLLANGGGPDLPEYVEPEAEAEAAVEGDAVAEEDAAAEEAAEEAA